MKISIITINWNNAKGLERTIESVVNQTYKNIEYIVIDGNSNDGSVDVIKKYADKLTYWISEPDKGIYNAMNKGALQASGDYSLFLNSGDKLITPQALETIVNKGKPTADIVSCDLFTDKQLRINFRQAPRKCPSELFMMMHNPIPHPSTLIKTSVIKKSLYNEESRIAGDYMFFFDQLIINKCSYQHIPIPLSLFYLDGISSSDGNKKGWKEGVSYLEGYIHPKIVEGIKQRPSKKEYILSNAKLELTKTSFNILYTIYILLKKIEYHIIYPIRSIYKNIKYKHTK